MNRGQASETLLRRAGLTGGPGPALRLREARTRLRLDWIVGAMAFLAALAFAGALTMHDQATRWRIGLAGTLTVEVPADRSATDLPAVLTVLRTSPGVERAEPLSREEIGRLLVPWLGTNALVDILPVPQLVDVALAPGAMLDTPALAQRLAEAAPGTTIDDHGRWVAQLLHLATLATLAAFVIVAIIALSAMVSVTITTRAGLALHHEAIDLLHLIGAEDRYIAREFAREALVLGLRGSLVGVAVAIGALYTLIALAPALESVLVPTLAPRPISILALTLVTVAAAALCGSTAWLTVMNELRKQI